MSTSAASTVSKIKRWVTHSPDQIAIIRLEGVIHSAARGGRGGLSGHGLEKQLERAFSLDDLKAVALVINSPGGSPAQSEYIAARIRQLAAEKGVRVLAFCEDVAASGGYWIACAADEIIAAKTSLIGSIGVISAGFGAVDLLPKLGLERRVHTAGENKSRLDIFSPENDDDVQWLLGLQQDLHETFIDWVRQRRGAKLVDGEVELFTGDVWIGTKARELGLIDGVGTLRSVLAERYPDAKPVNIAIPKPLLARVLGAPDTMRGAVADAVEGATEGALQTAERRAQWGSVGL